MKINYQFREENTQAFSGMAGNASFKEENLQAFSGMADTTSVSINYDYNKLKNKPSINTVELIGSISLPELGLRAIYYDTTANWNRQSSLITEAGVLYIYSDYSVYDDGIGNTIPLAGIKIGDGSSYLGHVPFITDGMTATLLSHISNTTVHITQAERTFWNSKVSAHMDSESAETLVLSNV